MKKEPFAGDQILDQKSFPTLKGPREAESDTSTYMERKYLPKNRIDNLMKKSWGD